jgi:hypothetical protein
VFARPRAQKWEVACDAQLELLTVVLRVSRIAPHTRAEGVRAVLLLSKAPISEWLIDLHRKAHKVGIKKV